MINSGSLPFDNRKLPIENYRVHNTDAAARNALAGELTPEHDGFHIWGSDSKLPYYWDGTKFVTGLAYTNEQAIAAVVGALTDTHTIDFTYSELLHKVRADVRYKHSITADEGGMMLIGDVVEPGKDMFYGTDEEGRRGWFPITFGGSGATYTFEETVISDKNAVSLFNDQQDPGLQKYYGTNTYGTKGWFALPNGGKTFTFPYSVKEQTGAITFVNDLETPGNLKYYGTNVNGTKGWFSLPIAGGAVLFDGSLALNSAGTTATLVNDQKSPAANHYYGTNVSGLKGWFELPKGGDGGNDIDLLVLEVRFKVGDAGCPEIGDNEFILTDCGGNPVLNKKIFFQRSCESLTQGIHFNYDESNGKISLPVEFTETESCVFQCWPKELWTVCNMGTGGGNQGSSNIFPIAFPLIF